MSQLSIETLITEALKNHNNKKYSDAEKLYKEILNISPNNINCINYLGTLFAQTNRIQLAEKEFLKALEIDPNNHFVNNNFGNILFEKGEYEKAVAHYLKAIKIQPNFIDANLNLGIIFKNQGNTENALNYLRKVIQIQPENIKALTIIAAIFKEDRKFKESFNCYKKIFKIDPENNFGIAGITDLFDNLRLNNLSKNNSADLLEVFLFLYKKNSINHNYLFNNVKNLILFQDDKKYIEKLLKTESNLIDDNFVKNILSKEIFHLILQKSLIRDKFLENFLLKVRKEIILLLKKRKITLLKEINNFILSLSEQSFLNEYIFFQTDEEMSLVEDLKKKVENNDLVDELEIAVLSCYLPLTNSTIIIDKLLKYKSKSNLFNDIIKIQIKDFIKEEQLKNTIKSSEILDNVSKKVRRQYEENPYPRWRYANFYPRLDFVLELNNDIYPNRVLAENNQAQNNILIAGCGTGLQLARRIDFKNSKVLAVDLSLSSLALAKRKIEELNINNVELLHTDILKLNNLGKRFNIIECMGVLHHLENPEYGFKILVDILEPKGFLKIGLYSDLARNHITKSREYIKEHKFLDSIKDIRNCREMIRNNKENKFFQKLNDNYDFYTTSSLRDLIFHVQEHRFSLPKISELLEKYNLEFLGFTNSSIKKDYSKYYPNDLNLTSLKNWNDFEIKNPDIFKGMYQFWVKKND